MLHDNAIILNKRLLCRKNENFGSVAVKTRVPW